MRPLMALSATLMFALVACGQAAAPVDAGAQTAATVGGEVTAAERAAILTALGEGGAAAQLENECGEMVAPQFLPADVGPGVGRAVAFVMSGGPNMASCYGDGPYVRLMRNSGGEWTEIYSRRGGMVAILPTRHRGGNDLADGGPGFSFPVWEWNGTAYAFAHREIADTDLGDARFLP